MRLKISARGSRAPSASSAVVGFRIAGDHADGADGMPRLRPR